MISCFHFTVTKLTNKGNLREDRFVAGRFQSVVMGRARQSSVGAGGMESLYSSEPGSRKQEAASLIGLETFAENQLIQRYMSLFINSQFLLQ